MTTRSFLTTLIATITIFMLPACGGSDDGDPNEGEGEAGGEAEGEAEAEGEGENFATFNATFTYEGEAHEFSFSNDPAECEPCPNDRNEINGLCSNTPHCSNSCETVGQYRCVIGAVSARNSSSARMGVRVSARSANSPSAAFIEIHLTEDAECSGSIAHDCFRFGRSPPGGDSSNDQRGAITYAEEEGGTRMMFHVERICELGENGCEGPANGVLDGNAFIPQER